MVPPTLTPPSAATATIADAEYASLLADVKARIRAAQMRALRAVNTELVRLYWDLGRLIVERQRDEAWGRAVVERLARDLQVDFPGTAGFSARNLWYMRELYVHYQATPFLQPLVAEISWSHNLLILERCADNLEREFYLKMTRQCGWSKRALASELARGTYQRTLASQTNFDTALATPTSARARLALRDEYTLDFLGLPDAHTERELEAAILRNVPGFLREMGGMFAFVGNQYPVSVGSKQYLIDLLLYNRALQALTAVELKSGEFSPEYVGKVQFYLGALDANVRRAEENPSVGIILCKSGDRTVVEYALRESRRPIGVATYRVVSAVPPEYAGCLPAPEQIAKLLEGVD